MDELHSVTLLGLCNDLLRRRWTVAAIAACCALASALLRMAQPATFTSVASFVPDAIQPLRGDAGVALSLDRLRGLPGGSPPLAGAGPSMPGRASSIPSAGAPVQPLYPGYYWRLLRSREVLVSVAGARYSVALPDGVRTGTAADVYGLAPGTVRRRTEDAARRVVRGMEIGYVDETGVISLSVRTFNPEFSRQVNERLLEAVRAHHRRLAASRGEAQITFLTRATADAQAELRVAQDGFERFLASNRAFVAASALALEFRRRDADVLEKRQRYAELAVQLARAKLDRSRAMPTIAVVQRPVAPARADARGALRATISGTVGGLALAALLVLVRAHLARLRESGYGELAALETEWRATLRRRTRVPRAGGPGGVAAGIGAGAE